MNDFSDYEKFVVNMKVYPEKGKIIYPGLALGEEAGEVQGKLAKWMRGDKELDPNAVALELGDVFWQLTALATDLGYSLRDIALMNVDKLTSRKERGVLRGEGDLR